MNRFIKALLICVSLIVTIGWLSYNNSSQSAPMSQAKPPAHKSDDYVGSDACKDCHEDQFKNFSHTSHAQLTKLASWKEKATGCESCHGPGKAHIEEGDPTKIISFKNKSSKETSETCLSCHAGREEHNNFRRGEHWRNDIGCTDCHSAHSPPSGRQLAASNVFVSKSNAQ
jgi:nitrate/TMAO reductase-like tetraheme cytochrome c subunit